MYKFFLIEDDESLAKLIKSGLERFGYEVFVAEDFFNIIPQFPLLFAGLHLVFAFPSLSKIMTLLNMSNTILFLKIYLVTYIVFSIIYVSIYAATTRAYQKVAGVYSGYK